MAGGAVSRFKSDSAGINPAWRESLGLFVNGISWPEGTPTAEINLLRQGAAAGLAQLDVVALNSATYFNEV